MTETFIAQDLYLPHDKKEIDSSTKPLRCHVCKKELNNMSITAKNINGKTVFLCSSHYKYTRQQISSVS